MKLCCVLPFLAPFAAATAAASDDFIAIASGNRMSGAIQELSRGELTFSIDGAGSVDINWNDVVELRSPNSFYVELTTGERLTGPLLLADGRLTVTTAAGPREIAMGDIARIDPTAAKTFDERLSGSVDVGFDFLSAGDEIDWTLNAQVEHRTTHYLTEASFSSLLRRRDDDTSQRRNHFELGSRRFLERRWFALGRFVAEEDRELDLDSRYLLGASLGRTISQSQRAIFATYAGLDADRESFRGYDSDTLLEVHGAVEWDWFEIGGNTELKFRTIAYYAPEKSRTRLDLSASLRRDIANDFYWALYVYESYNTDPPEGLEKSDLGVTITLGRSF